MNNKGISLIELLVAIAISAIIITAIGQAMVMGMRHYSLANNEATLQERAQIVMNILQDEIVDSTKNPVLDPASGPLEDGKNTNTIKLFHGENGELETQVRLRSADPESYELIYEDLKNSNSEILASGVKSFRCTQNGAAIKIEIILVEGKRSYGTSNSVFMRNYESF